MSFAPMRPRILTNNWTTMRPRPALNSRRAVFLRRGGSHSVSLSPSRCGLSERVCKSSLEGAPLMASPWVREYSAYYLRPDENTLRIVRVLHGKRDLAHIFEEEQGDPQISEAALGLVSELPRGLPRVCLQFRP